MVRTDKRMYRLTPRMLQHFRHDLEKYHQLFTGGRCSGWELEELLVRAIKSDTQAAHHVRWKEAGHDDEADIVVRTNGDEHPIQVKSGKIQVKKNRLVLSGHRLGRFQEDLNQITEYLNSKSANFISVPHRLIEDGQGRRHAYKLTYMDAEKLRGLAPGGWSKSGSAFKQENDFGVDFSLNPSMSWQVWWSIPMDLVEETDEFVID